MSVAQTAVVLSISECAGCKHTEQEKVALRSKGQKTSARCAGGSCNKVTTVVGVLSNEPFEERGEFPLGLKRPNTEVIAMWTKNGRVFEEVGTTDAQRDELCATTKRLNDAIDRDWINVWAGTRRGRPGTTVILSGVRQHFRANELGRKAVLHQPPRVRIKFDPDDMTLCQYNKDKNSSEPFRHHPTARRVIGTSTRMDSSFRALCEAMFLDAGPTKDLKINLFGSPVARVSYIACLRNPEQVKIKDGPASVSCVIGRHTFPGDEDMYGAMLYCENTLITAYARPLSLEFKNGRGNKDDEEHFSTVAVINLRKEDGFKPTPEKLEFHFNDQDKEAFWNVLKDKIEDYADKQGTRRDEAFPLRPLFLRLLKDLKTQLRDYHGVQSGDEGPLRGVLHTPPHESVGEDVETYHTCIKNPITLHAVELKAKTLGTDAPKYAGTTGTQIAAFKKDLTRVFQNSIKWESEGRFIPDSVGDLDINDCTAADITASSTRPFNTGKKGPFTMHAIFQKRGIPPEFSKATVGANKDDFPDLTDKREFKCDTSVLLPHSQSIAAVVFAKKLLKVSQDRVGGFQRVLVRNEMAKQRARRDDLADDQVQCNSCLKWRKVSAAVVEKYPEGVDFRCEMENRGCEEPEDYNSSYDITMSQQHDEDDDEGSGAALPPQDDGSAVAGPGAVPAALLTAPVLTPALGSTPATPATLTTLPTVSVLPLALGLPSDDQGRHGSTSPDSENSDKPAPTSIPSGGHPPPPPVKKAEGANADQDQDVIDLTLDSDDDDDDDDDDTSTAVSSRASSEQAAGKRRRMIDSDDEDGASNAAPSRAGLEQAAGKRRRVIDSDDEDEAPNAAPPRVGSEQAAGKRRQSLPPASSVSPTRSDKRPRHASTTAAPASDSSRSKSGAGASALELPDPKSVADRTIRAAKTLADALSHRFVSCAAAFEKRDFRLTTEHMDTMLELWREVEESQKEADVINKLSPASKKDWMHLQDQIKARPPRVSPPLLKKFLKKLKEVNNGLGRGHKKLSDRKAAVEPRAKGTGTDRAGPAPRVPQELAPSTLHKDPKRVVAEAAKLGIANAPATHAGWLAFAKARPIDADRLIEALRATREREMQQNKNRAAK